MVTHERIPQVYDPSTVGQSAPTQLGMAIEVGQSPKGTQLTLPFTVGVFGHNPGTQLGPKHEVSTHVALPSIVGSDGQVGVPSHVDVPWQVSEPMHVEFPAPQVAVPWHEG